MAVQFRAHVVDGMSRDPGSISKSNQLQEALRSAAQATLTTSERKSPGWYEAEERGSDNVQPGHHTAHHGNSLTKRHANV